MRIVALGQQKGGCGKSAAAINLACQAVAHGKRAAIIDMDADQGTARKWGQRRSDKPAPLVCIADVITLDATLGKLEADGYDWVFLDLPGRSAPVASAGLTAANLILIPCRPLDVDVEASISTVRAAKGSGKPYAYLMNIAMPQHEMKRAKQMSSTLAALGHPVAPTIIVQNVAVPDAMADGKGVNEDKPKSKSAVEFSELFTWLNKQVQK